MGVQIIQNITDDISLFDLKDGEIAIITKWHGEIQHLNEIVQRYKNSLIAIGKGSGNSWSNIFNSTLPDGLYKVKVLPVGTEFIIT